ncbi:MAG TPA: AI-2E family transporter [Anaerolineae bacterium]|nr:AI-2E family transporter [Anaerolineae bacterium]
MENKDLRQRIFFFLVFLILIILSIVMLRPFLTAIIVSLISVIILKPVYSHILDWSWIKKRHRLAASLTLIAVLLILVIPVLLLVWLTLSQLSGLFDQLATYDLESAIQKVNESLEALPLLGDLTLPDVDIAEALQTLVRATAQALADLAVGLVSSLPSLFAQGIIFVVLVASLLPVYDTLIPQLEEISPLGPELSELYTLKITAMVKSLVMGVFLIAVIQGAAMGVFFWIAGLPYVFLFTLLSMLLALIPMVGISWLVIAIAVVSILTGNYSQALIILFGFYGVVNWIDLLLRPKMLSEEASLNLALFILAIFGGLAWAGVMGLFYGPVIMLLLVTTINIYAERYAKDDRSTVNRVVKNLVNGRKTDRKEAQAEQE